MGLVALPHLPRPQLPAAKVNRTGKDPVLLLTDDTGGAQTGKNDHWCQASKSHPIICRFIQLFLC